jgi:hypothetical protein
MSIQYTYTTLVAIIKSYSSDIDSEFVAAIPDFIAKGETRCLRDLDLELFEQWIDVTVTGGSRLISKPSDAIEINDLFIRNPAALTWIECPRRAFGYALMYAPTEATTGVPVFYSEYDEDSIYVVPTPDQSYTAGNAKVRATIRPTGLSAANENSWLGDNMADLLYHACMIEAYDFLKHGAKMQEAATKYQSLIPSLTREIEDIVRKKYKGLSKQTEGADD